MKKTMSSLVLALGLLSNLPAHAFYEPYRPSAAEELCNAFMVGSGIIIGTSLAYLAGRCLSTRAIDRAKEFFADQLSLIGNRMYFDESTFASSLKRTILQSSESYFNSWWRFGAYEEYKNYPLVFFKLQLDQTIINIRILGLFRLGTSGYDEVQTILSHLEDIAKFLQSDYEFIKERRRFEERFIPPYQPPVQQNALNNIQVSVTLK